MEKPVIRKWIINRLLFTSRAKSLNAEGEGNTMVSDSISVIKVAKQPLWGNFIICMKADMQIKYKWSIIKQVFYGYYGYICCKRMAKKSSLLQMHNIVPALFQNETSSTLFQGK